MTRKLPCRFSRFAKSLRIEPKFRLVAYSAVVREDLPGSRILSHWGSILSHGVHAHVALLGWATMAITGIVYLVMPDCARSKLVTFHFWGHNIGLPLMVASLAVKDYVRADMGSVIGAGSTLVLVSLVVFAINLFRNGGLNYSRTPSAAS